MRWVRGDTNCAARSCGGAVRRGGLAAVPASRPPPEDGNCVMCCSGREVWPRAPLAVESRGMWFGRRDGAGVQGRPTPTTRFTRRFGGCAPTCATRCTAKLRAGGNERGRRPCCKCAW